MASEMKNAMSHGPALATFPEKIKKSELIRNRIAKLKAILYKLIFFIPDS